MAAKITLKLSNRCKHILTCIIAVSLEIYLHVPIAPKQPIKKLPETIEVSSDATIEDVKLAIARQTGISDFNRVGLFDPSTQKTLKNRKAQISSEQAVISAGQVLVKDLGASNLSNSALHLERMP